MTTLSTLLKQSVPSSRPALPALNALESAANRVISRWPDVVAPVAERDRESLVQSVRRRLESDQWEGVRLSFVTRAARVAFDADFRERDDLAAVRDFYVRETRASTRSGFLGAMMSIYIGSYSPGAAHTRALAGALMSVQDRLGGRWRSLLARVPRLLDPWAAHEQVATLMVDMEYPWAGLKTMGIQSPHAPGLMDHAHLAFLRKVAPNLAARREIDRLFAWLKPDGHDARSSGATEAIEAILSPWTSSSPDPDLQLHLVERLVSLYGDPRIRRGPPWGAADKDLAAIMLRWLTGENIRFFLDVVSAVEQSHMWAPRRKFWLDLYERNMIDEAWVAFSPVAVRKAKELHARQESRVGLAYGTQEAGGGRKDTSLLVLRLGNCIVVEGSHSYKVHVFRTSNPKAPKLFQPRYDCESIRYIPDAQTTAHLGDWQSRVREMIGYWS